MDPLPDGVIIVTDALFQLTSCVVPLLRLDPTNSSTTDALHYGWRCSLHPADDWIHRAGAGPASLDAHATSPLLNRPASLGA